MLVGYARASTSAQDLSAQQAGLEALGVASADVHIDHGVSGTHRDRPGLREALAAARAGDTLFNVLEMVAEFEADLIGVRTREGMAIARAKSRLRGAPPKLSPAQERHLVELYENGEHTSPEIAAVFGVARSTAYCALHRGVVTPDRAFGEGEHMPISSIPSLGKI